MKEFIEFLKEYWFELSAGLFALIEIILIIVKRKPKSIDDFKLAVQEALAIVPELVLSCERPGEGYLKKQEVILSSLKLVSRLLGRKLTDNEVRFVSDSVSDKIETVLSTPTKKEI